MNRKSIYYQKQKGAALLISVLFFLIISATLLIGIVSPISNQIRNTSESLTSKQSYAIADSQAENAMYRLNAGRTDSPTPISLLGATASVVVTDVGADKQAIIEGVAGEFKRYIRAMFGQNDGASFYYGLQSGVGGIEMLGNSYIVGNVYSNGDIVGSGPNTYITSSAIAANVSNPIPFIDNATPGAPSDSSVNVGQNNANQDFAQSFVYSTSTPLTELQLYMKKTSTPANAEVKIVNDNAGSPGSTVLVSGTLSSTLVTSLYSYVPVSMTTGTALVSGTTYWMIIDISNNSNTRYYTLGLNDNIYAGNTKIGQLGYSWSNLSTTTLDLKFRAFVGGNVGSISDVSVGTDNIGNTWANTVNNVSVGTGGTIYCQFGTGNSEACDTSRVDPSQANPPIAQGNIDEWKSRAEAGGATSSILIGGSVTRSLGPIKINGNLDIQGTGKLYLTGPIYVTGNINLQGGGEIHTDASINNDSAIVISDGIIDLQGSGGIYGSGAPGSYVFLVTTSSCPGGSNCPGNNGQALIVTGSAGSVIVIALDGTVELQGSVGLKSIVAKKIIMGGSSNVTYEFGLVDINFDSGPSGGWGIESWSEVEEN